jgi:hypothetical protein
MMPDDLTATTGRKPDQPARAACSKVSEAVKNGTFHGRSGKSRLGQGAFAGLNWPADRSASEAAATDASAEAGPDRSATETTPTYCRSPKATADRAPAETATHPTAPETAAHPAAVEASHPATAHSSTTALRRSHVRKESGRNQRCRTENTNLIHGRLLDSSLQMPP